MRPFGATCFWMPAHRERKARRFLIASLWAPTGSVGCHPWYLVESRGASVDLQEKRPEITQSGDSTLLPKRFKIALLAPDTCAPRSWAEGSGEAKTRERLLQTNCGVAMAELERALVQQGWSVSSWKAVDQLVRADRISALQAAQKLGARVILQVNSLERSEQYPLKDLNWDTQFYESDRTGRKGGLAPVPEQRAQALESGLKKQQEQIREFMTPRVGASIT